MLDQTISQMVDTGAGALVPSTNIDDGQLTEKQVMARVRELGKKEGQGDNSRPGIFLVTVEGAKRRAINKSHVAEIFAEYSKASAMARGVGWKRQDSEKQQVSKLAVAARLGELPHVDGMALMEKIIGVQKEQRLANDGKMDYSPFDGMVKVARYQVTQSPTVMLDDEVIRGLLLKPTKDLPGEADRLDKILKAVNGLAEAKEEPVSEGTLEVLHSVATSLSDQIKALGGTTGENKRKSKAQAELSELVSRGRQAEVELSTI